MSGKQPDPDAAACRPWGPTLVPVLTEPAPPGGDPDDLHAWIDGELPAREAASVGRHLSHRPALAARAAAYRAQVDELHAIYDSVLDEPIPPQLLAVVARRRAAPPARSRWGWRRGRMLMLAAAAATASIITAGALLALPPGPPAAGGGAAGAADVSAVARGP